MRLQNTATGPLLLMMLLALACSTGSDTGDGLESATIHDPGTELWRFETSGQIWSSPAVHDGVVLFGNDDGSIYSVEAGTGELLWEFATEGRVRSRAAICAGKAIFAADDGHLHALDPRSGGEVWSYEIGDSEIPRRLPDPGPPYDYDYMTSAAACADDKIYIGSADGRLHVLDAETGEEKWRFEAGGKIRSTPLIRENRVYFGSWDQHVYALEAATGKEIWKFDTGGLVQGSPTYGDGKIFIGSRNPKVFALDATTGVPVWEYVHEDGSWVESSAVFADGTVYIGSSDALVLQALDAATGEELWRYKTDGWSWSTPVVTEETIYIGAIAAYPYYFEGVDLRRGFHAVDRRTGEVKWSIETGELSEGYLRGGVYASPARADGLLYVAALDGNLYALQE